MAGLESRPRISMRGCGALLYLALLVPGCSSTAGEPARPAAAAPARAVADAGADSVVVADAGTAAAADPNACDWDGPGFVEAPAIDLSAGAVEEEIHDAGRAPLAVRRYNLSKGSARRIQLKKWSKTVLDGAALGTGSLGNPGETYQLRFEVRDVGVVGAYDAAFVVQAARTEGRARVRGLGFDAEAATRYAAEAAANTVGQTFRIHMSASGVAAPAGTELADLGLIVLGFARFPKAPVGPGAHWTWRMRAPGNVGTFTYWLDELKGSRATLRFEAELVTGPMRSRRGGAPSEDNITTTASGTMTVELDQGIHAASFRTKFATRRVECIDGRKHTQTTTTDTAWELDTP